MLDPRSHADPAEFMLALLACHMTDKISPSSVTEHKYNTRVTETYLHPPFFSIVLWHLVHSFVLLLIQFAVSLSS